MSSIFIFIGAQNTEFGDIKAHSISIINNDGKETLWLGNDERWGWFWKLFNRRGNRTSSLGFSHNQSGSLSLFNGEGKAISYFSDYLVTFNSNEKQTTYLGNTKNGGGYLATFNSDGAESVSLGVDDKENSGHLKTFNKDGAKTSFLGSNIKGIGHLFIYGAEGNKTNFLGSSSEGKGYLATYNLNSITGYFGTGPNNEVIIGLHDAIKFRVIRQVEKQTKIKSCYGQNS